MPTPHLRQTFLRRYYAYRFVDQFVPVYPLYVVLFVNRGLSVFEISLLLTIWNVGGVVLEVPSGALADRWNRPAMLALHALGKAACYTCWLFADGFGLFALGFFFWGSLGTFKSGTSEALLYDALASAGETAAYERIAGRSKFYELTATCIAALLGSVLVLHSFELVLICSIAPMLVAAVIGALLRDVGDVRTSTGEVRLVGLVRDAVRQARGRPELRRAMSFAMLGVAVVGTLEEYDQVFLEWIDIPLLFFGTWFIVMMGSRALGARWAHRVAGPGRRRVKYACGVVAAACLVVAALGAGPAILPIYLGAYVAMAVGEVAVEAELQREIRSEQRATIISINHLLMNAATIPLALVFGVASRFGGVQLGLITFAAVMFFASTVGFAELLRDRAVGALAPRG